MTDLPQVPCRRVAVAGAERGCGRELRAGEPAEPGQRDGGES